MPKPHGHTSHCDCDACRNVPVFEDEVARKIPQAEPADDPAITERARIVAMLLDQADLLPCEEDAVCWREAAEFVRADGSFQGVEDRDNLIEAAPALLAAVEVALPFLKHEASLAIPRDYREAMDAKVGQCIAAIKAARGTEKL